MRKCEWIAKVSGVTEAQGAKPLASVSGHAVLFWTPQAGGKRILLDSGI